MKRAVVWFRNDLRLRDNVTLTAALEWADEVIPVYCWSPLAKAPTRWGFPKMGAFRAQFLHESLCDLQANLRALDAELWVLEGEAAQLLPQVCLEFGATRVYYSEEVTAEELQASNALHAALDRLNIDWSAHWNATLVDKAQLPFSVRNMPDVFTAFRTKVEREQCFGRELPPPDEVPVPHDMQQRPIPSLAELGYTTIEADESGVMPFKGGETAAWRRLDDYIWDADCLKEYKQTRNGLVGANYSSKFSPWLSVGAVSARSIYEEVCEYEAERVKNDSTYWMIFELLWRDFFRFTAAKQGNALFYLSGFGRGAKRPWKQDTAALQRWINGQTGDAFVDANMIEVQRTGWMSNRGRQNVASYLVHELGLDWRMGAAYFESQLIDYDVCSNWGNWAYVAGVGNDPRPDRKFNTARQAMEYDRDGTFRQLWMGRRNQQPLAHAE